MHLRRGLGLQEPSTVVGSASLTEFQGGWSSALIHTMTFATSSLSAGEYVIGNIVNFSASSSNMSVSLYGADGLFSSTSSAAFATALAAAGSASVLSNAGTALVTFVSSAASLAVTNVEASSTFASSASSTYSAWERMNAIARTVLTASTSASGTHFTVAPTQATAISSVAVAALSSITHTGVAGAQMVFSIQNTGSVFSTASADYFLAGQMSTGAIPANITLTSTNVTFSGSVAYQQPWFALIGS